VYNPVGPVGIDGDVLHVDKPTGDSHMSRRWTAGSVKNFTSTAVTSRLRRSGACGVVKIDQYPQARPQLVHNIVRVVHGPAPVIPSACG
jgi:hypothetical protein